MSPIIKASFLRPLSIGALARCRGLKVTRRATPRIQGSKGYITRTDTRIILHVDGQEPQPLSDFSEASMSAAFAVCGIETPEEQERLQQRAERQRERADARAFEKQCARPSSWTNIGRLLIATLPIKASGPFEAWPRNEP